MDDYFIDRETLGKFIDELIKKKPLSVDNVEDLDALREKNIKLLDDEICQAIPNSMTEEQKQEFNRLLDSPEDSPEIFSEFFQKNNINLEEVITNAMRTFSMNFLGGENV